MRDSCPDIRVPKAKDHGDIFVVIDIHLQQQQALPDRRDDGGKKLNF